MSETTAGKVFLSYRQGDDAPVAEQLHYWLEEEFGTAAEFVNAQSSSAGREAKSGLNERAAECDVLLVLISEAWLDAADGSGGRLLDSADDPVLIQVAPALSLGKQVIPVLVNGTEMPGAGRLPEPLKPLVYYNAVQLSHEHVPASLDVLAAVLRTALADAKRNEGSSAGAALPGHADGAPTVVKIGDGGEAAVWDLLKDRRRAPELRDPPGNTPDLPEEPPVSAVHPDLASWDAFLNRFPVNAGVETVRERLLALGHEAEADLPEEPSELAEAKAWAIATSSGSIEELKAFLKEWPSGKYSGEAREWLQALELAMQAAWAAETRRRAEAKDWANALSGGGILDYRAYLSEWPEGEHAEEGRARLRVLEAEANAAWEEMARKLNEMSAWEYASRSGSIAEIRAFQEDWPASRFAGEARARISELSRPQPTRRNVLAGLGIGAAAITAGGVVLYAVSRPGEETPSQPGVETPKAVFNAQPVRTFAGHAAWIHSVAISPDGRSILSGSGDNALKLWDTATGKELHSFAGFPDEVRSAAFSPDGRVILCGGGNNTLFLLDAAAGKVLRTFKGHRDGIPAVAFSPDGRRVLSGSWDKTLKLWDAASGKELRTFAGHSGEVHAASFSPDGRMVLSGSRDRTLKLWDAATGKELRTFTGHTDWISAVVFSPDGRTVLSSSTDRTLKLWDIASGQELRTFPDQAREFNPVAFSPDGRAVLAGGHSTLTLWDAATGRQLGAFAGHTGGVTAVTISPDGRTAVSGSADQTLKLWNMAAGAT